MYFAVSKYFQHFLTNSALLLPELSKYFIHELIETPVPVELRHHFETIDGCPEGFFQIGQVFLAVLFFPQLMIYGNQHDQQIGLDLETTHTVFVGLAEIGCVEFAHDFFEGSQVEVPGDVDAVQLVHLSLEGDEVKGETVGGALLLGVHVLELDCEEGSQCLLKVFQDLIAH